MKRAILLATLLISSVAMAGGIRARERLCRFLFKHHISAGGALGCAAYTGNTITSSLALDSNPPWVPNANGGPAVPVVTPAAAVSPDGGTIAFRVDFDAASGSAYSYLESQTSLTPNAVNSCSVWVSGAPLGGVEDFCIYDGAAARCQSCTYQPGPTWTLCRVENVAVTGPTLAFEFGALPSQHNGTARIAQSAYLWGPECNPKAYAVPLQACDLGALDAGQPEGGLPFFAFAPPTGAGLSGECSTAPVEGAKGEVATFTRASSAYCTIGNETSGLSNSSMVLLGSNVARAQKSGSGTGSVGFLGEEVRTNDAIQSQAFDNAAWGVLSLVVATPIVTANAAVAPDGTTTAERIQFPAVAAAAQVSLLDQTGLGGGQRSLGLYLKGVSGSGVLHLMNGAPYTCTLCAYNSTSWTRCAHENSPGTEVYFGLDPIDCGGGARAAQDVYAWQFDDQNGPSLTSPIATTTAAATRAEDVGLYFAGVSFAGMTTAGSVSFTITNRPAALAAGGAFAAHAPAASEQPATIKDDATLLQVYDGTNVVAVASGQPSASGKHYWVSWTGTTLTVTNATDSVQTVGTFDGTFDTGSGIDVGFLRLATNYPLNGTVSNLCLDPSPTRCR